MMPCSTGMSAYPHWLRSLPYPREINDGCASSPYMSSSYCPSPTLNSHELTAASSHSNNEPPGAAVGEELAAMSRSIWGSPAETYAYTTYNSAMNSTASGRDGRI